MKLGTTTGHDATPNQKLSSEILASHEEHKAAIDIDAKELKQCNCAQVMVVDDEPFNVMTLVQLLSKSNLKCLTAYNGSDALIKINRKEGCTCSDNPRCRWIKLILMDKNMPVMDGIEAAREIRRLIREGDLEPKSIVGNTAYVGQKEIDAFLHAGVQEILFKPLDRAKLNQVVAKYLESLQEK